MSRNGERKTGQEVMGNEAPVGSLYNCVQPCTHLYLLKGLPNKSGGGYTWENRLDTER